MTRLVAGVVLAASLTFATGCRAIDRPGTTPVDTEPANTQLVPDGIDIENDQTEFDSASVDVAEFERTLDEIDGLLGDLDSTADNEP